MKIKITPKRAIVTLFFLFFIWLLIDSSIPNGVDETIVRSQANRLYQNLGLVDNYGGVPTDAESFIDLLAEWDLKGDFVFGEAVSPGQVGFQPMIISDMPAARVTGMGNKKLIFDETYTRNG